MDSLERYDNKKYNLIRDFSQVVKSGKKILLKKKTISNLFRYGERKKEYAVTVSLSQFNQIIKIDTNKKILEVEGLTTYEKIADYCLNYNLLPTVTPELKNITIGGAIVG
ncbi:FAD-binding oxidoreductase, partial [Candidatus Woesearchaeota archaeon]|nr:FAD-binding oxidoreductase [Candidatus Woesearchaeota archaeon]